MALRLSPLDLQRCHSSFQKDSYKVLPDFRADWAKANAGDKEIIFQRERKILNDSYKQLGLIGELFNDSFMKTGCQEVMVLDDKQTPSFQGHNYHPGHKNKTLFGGWCFEDREKFQDSCNHERAHAIQDAISAIAHAIPYNGNTFEIVTPIAGISAGVRCHLVLTPREYVLLEELKERGSYAMQKILSELRSPDFDPKTQLGQGLRDYAAKVLETCDITGSNPVISHLTHYRQKAIDNYKFMMIKKDGQPYDDIKVLYVTFEKDDIVALGNICGLTIFGDKKDNMDCWRATPLTAKEEADIAELTTTLKAHNSVSFRTALKAIGLTPQEFLTRSRAPRSQNFVSSPIICPAPAVYVPVVTVPMVPVPALSMPMPICALS